MIFIAPTMVVTDYLEIISLKTVNDITADTKSVITYYGKTYTDDQKIALDDYLVGIQAATYYSRLKHILCPFLAPNMTGAQIAANVATANKAFYDLKQRKLPDGTLGGNVNMFNGGYASYLQLTDTGILCNTAIPAGSSYSINALYTEDVTSANNFSAGVLSTSTNLSSSRFGAYSFFKSGAAFQVGAASVVTTFTANDITKLAFVNHSSAANADTILINNGVAIQTTQYNASNYDTTIKNVKLFADGVNDVGKTFSFAFISDLMTNAELADFYTKTSAFLTAFGVI